MNAPKPPPFGRGEALAQQPKAAPQNNLIVRGQTPAEEASIAPPRLPSQVQIPSREELGLLTSNRGAGPALSTDWNSARQQLHRWQANFYRLEKTADGHFRFVCALPYPTGGKLRQFEATAASEGEAMKAVLDQVSLWHQSQR